MVDKKNYIDIFAGCGGLSTGLLSAGWTGLFAIEKNADAFSTLKHNLINNQEHFLWPSWLPIQECDINELLKKHADDLRALQGKVTLVAGGPPCQGFSMAGKRDKNDQRNKLVKSYIKFINESATKEKTRKTAFFNIPREWAQYLVGYEFEAVNKDGSPKLTKGKQPVRRQIDYLDLMLLDEIRSFAKRKQRDCLLWL